MSACVLSVFQFVQAMRTLKVIILGNSGVGKTSLVSRLSPAHAFAHVTPTVGLDYTSVLVDEGRLKLAVWDTAGQERFESLTKLSFSSAQVIWLVYAANNMDSLKALRAKWWPEVRRACAPMPVVVVIGNKADTADGTTTGLDAQVAAFLEEDIKAHASAVFHFRVSAMKNRGCLQAVLRAVTPALKDLPCELTPGGVVTLRGKRGPRACCWA